MKIKTQDGFDLDAVYNQIDSEKAVIFAHGITVDKNGEGIFNRAEPKLNNLGIATLRFDFRGHGESEGISQDDFYISSALKDLQAAYEFLQNKGFEKIGLAGASFGGGTASIFAGNKINKINALFLANPCLDYEKNFLNPITPWAKKYFKNAFLRVEKKGYIKIGSSQTAYGKRFFKEMKKYYPCKELNNYKKPILIVHGTDDKYVSFENVQQCFQSLENKNKEFLPMQGADHGFGKEPYQTKVTELIVEFFDQTL